VYGIDNFLADLATERKRIESFLDRLVEIHIQGLEPFLKAVGPYVQVIWMGDDLGMQMGPFMSPRMFQEVLKPRYKAIYDEVKKKSGLPIMLHSCGSIYRLLPDLIEMGVDIINPVQVSAAEMDPVRLKDDFGQDVVFWGGGVDTQNVLSRKGPDEVRQDTGEKMRVFSPGGGFVFNPVHNIQADVPPENILAMYDAFCAERGYPVGQR
jgi:uroporphyrinogen decarboxylase